MEESFKAMLRRNDSEERRRQQIHREQQDRALVEIARQQKE